MKQLISVITKQILKQIRQNEINMVRLESFDSPIIYRSVCENLRQSDRAHTFIPKLTLEKYRQFETANNLNWTQALMYLHKGENLSFSASPDAQYAERSYVDFAQAITNGAMNRRICRQAKHHLFCLWVLKLLRMMPVA